MKLALIRRQFSATGGAELYLQRLAQSLVSAGHEVSLLTEKWDNAHAGVRVITMPVSGSRAERPARFADAVETQLAIDTFDCVFSLERTRRQDVYRAGDGVHRVWLERRKQFAPWWRKPFIGLGAFHSNVMGLEKQTFDPRNTRRIIVNSEMVKHEILQHFRFPEDRIHLVRNGIETRRFQNSNRVESRKRWGFSDQDYVLLFCGSGWERKGLKYVLQALLPRAPFKLLVVGKGHLPSNAPSNVIFTGALSDVENAYAAADLFVFPPIYEPSSNVVFEALAAGLPVITSAYNGASEALVEGVTGTVVQNPSDITALTRAIQFWFERRNNPRPQADLAALSLERNVAETIAILELAAREKKGEI